MWSTKVVLLTFLCVVCVINAQKCLQHPCGKLKCTRTACRITKQEDCATGETYLYPGLICECCGACVHRTLRIGSQCTRETSNSHVSGCEEGSCCSDEGNCVQKTSEYGA